MTETHKICLVLFADVWGFSEQMKKPGDAVKRLLNLYRSVEGYCESIDGATAICASDSIFFAVGLSSKEKDFHHNYLKVHAFIKACERLYIDSLIKDLPLRGAICSGELVRAQRAVVGPALEQAVSSEKVLSICAITITSQTITELDKICVDESGTLGLGLSPRLIIELPLKTGVGWGMVTCLNLASVTRATSYFQKHLDKLKREKSWIEVGSIARTGLATIKLFHVLRDKISETKGNTETDLHRG